MIPGWAAKDALGNLGPRAAQSETAYELHCIIATARQRWRAVLIASSGYFAFSPGFGSEVFPSVGFSWIESNSISKIRVALGPISGLPGREP